MELRETAGKWKQGKGEETGPREHADQTACSKNPRGALAALRINESSRDASKRNGFTTTVKAKGVAKLLIMVWLLMKKKERFDRSYLNLE